MRFKQFISESRAKALSLEEAAKWIKENSKIMMEELKLEEAANLLFRGRSWGGDINLADSRTSLRKSANSSNEYTLLIDSSPAWKNFPKRSKSFICTSNFGYARGYGPVSIVFPPDSTVMACSGAKDFWISFPALKMINVSNLPGFNWYLDRMLAFGGKTVQDENIENLRKDLRSITLEILSAVDPKDLLAKSSLDAMKRLNVSNLEDLVEKLLDPEENGSHTFQLSQWENFYTEHNEYWFSDEAVFIPHEMKDALLELLE